MMRQMRRRQRKRIGRRRRRRQIGRRKRGGRQVLYYLVLGILLLLF